MLACSFCTTVAPAEWFPLGPIVVLLGVGGAVGIAVLVTARTGRREGLGAVLLGGAALAVLASIVVGDSARTRIDVETTPPPMDSPAWSVTCESPFQAPVEGLPVSAEFHEACAASTAGERAVIYLLLAVAGALLVASSVALWPAPSSQRRPERAPDAGERPTAAC